jgi:tRNA-splicing ligase RtcB (3'-phosphate/5'-hydroxy nucleic acid ligase)
MSLKVSCQKVSANQYVLPRVGSMKVDAHAFFSEALFEASEESMWRQLAAAASYQGVIGAYLMPDAHSGFGVPVGCVIVTDNTLIQAGSGYDISCGVLLLRVPGLTAGDVADWGLRARWVSEVESRVATGIGSHRPSRMRQTTQRHVDEILRFGAKAVGVPADLCERQYIPLPDDIDLYAIERAYGKSLAQLGSVGGGNHFIEMQVDHKTGDVWVMVHCGSRGYGWQTANHFFYQGAELRGLPTNRREDSWLYAGEPLGRAYWAYHNSAANYAIANRHIIVRAIIEALDAVFSRKGEVYYEISHNLVQRETLVLPNGTTQKGFVHRKGATRALPAGHPDLVGTAWQRTGHPCLVPGSMYEGAAILFAEPGAQRSGYSINHGSGRLMARGAAKRTLKDSQARIDDDMRTIERDFAGVTVRGIVGNTEHTPLDECAHVYKNLDEVLRVLEAEGIAKVVNRLYPVANLKGAD